MNSGLLLVLSGASGSGKSTVLSELLKLRDDLCMSVSATTRSPRPGECDGVDYHFVSREEFNDMISAGRLLEYAEYVNNFYGTPLEAVERDMAQGKCVILEIEVKGAKQIREKCPESIHVFIAPSTFSELRQRLTARNTERPEVLEMRIAAAKREYREAVEYDYIVINDDIKRAASEISAIITAELCKTDRRINIIMEGIDSDYRQNSL